MTPKAKADTLRALRLCRGNLARLARELPGFDGVPAGVVHVVDGLVVGCGQAIRIIERIEPREASP